MAPNQVIPNKVIALQQHLAQTTIASENDRFACPRPIKEKG